MVQDDEEEEEEEKCPSVAWLLRGLFVCPLFAPSLKAGNFFFYYPFHLTSCQFLSFLCLTTGSVLILFPLLHFQVAYFAAVYLYTLFFFFTFFKCSDGDGGGRLMLLFFQGIRQCFLGVRVLRNVKIETEYLFPHGPKHV